MKPLVPASLLLIAVGAFAQAPDDWKEPLKKPARAEAALAPASALPAAPVSAGSGGESSSKSSSSSNGSANGASKVPAASGSTYTPSGPSATPTNTAAGVAPLLGALAPSEDKTKLEKITTLNQLDQQEFVRKLRPINEEKDETAARYNLRYEKNKLEFIPQETELRKLQLDTALADEKRKKDNAALRAEIERLQLETSLAEEKRRKDKLAVMAENERIRLENERARFEIESQKIKMDAADLKISAAMRELDFQSRKLRAEMELADQRSMTLKSDLELRGKKSEWKKEANREPEYPKEPFVDGALTISDRRIPLNGPIMYGVADFVTERIDFFNNKSHDLPIYIVIDRSPGGSVLEGYRIVKAIQTSKAPVHVVVKQYAASMAATIATLAPKSYAYPNAIILHHQIFSFTMGNPTQQKQQLDVINEWNRRLLSPVAKKMGLSLDALTKKMYDHSVDGDWEEFADEAVRLKWIDHVANQIQETGMIKEPEDRRSDYLKKMTGLSEETDASGERFVRLPRLQPFDAYFLYNKDNYYR